MGYVILDDLLKIHARLSEGSLEGSLTNIEKKLLNDINNYFYDFYIEEKNKLSFENRHDGDI